MALCWIAVAYFVVLLFIPAGQMPIQIGRETTYVLEPLRDDGSVDYAAAINAINRQAVTAENNAAIPLLSAVGLPDVALSVQKRIFAELGAEPLPEDREYFVPLWEYALSSGTVRPPADMDEWEREEFDKGQREHWRMRASEAMKGSAWEGDFAIVAGWVEHNEPALALLREAAACERFYWPVVIPRYEQFLTQMALPPLDAVIDATGCVAVRARMAMSRDDPHAAWRDIYMLLRLSALLADAAPLVIRLVAIATRSLALEQAMRLLDGEVGGDLALQMIADLGALPPWPTMEKTIRFDLRYVWLDAISLMVRGAEAEGGRGFDPNVALRQINHWADRFEAVAREPVSRDTIERWADLAAERDRYVQAMRGLGVGDVARILMLPRSAGGEAVMSEKIASLIVGMTFTSTRPLKWEMDHAVQLDLVRLGVALQQHRIAYGHFPDELDVLTPHFISALPTDPFTGQSLIYRREEDGFVLYSVGSNMHDDGDLEPDDSDPNASHDLFLRVTAGSP